MELLLLVGIRKAQQVNLPGCDVIKQMPCPNFLHYHRNMDKLLVYSPFYLSSDVLHRAGE